jgi:hypothetical protein
MFLILPIFQDILLKRQKTALQRKTKKPKNATKPLDIVGFKVILLPPQTKIATVKEVLHHQKLFSGNQTCDLQSIT